MSGGFEIGASAQLRALHRIPWKEGPEAELHEEEYRVEVVIGRRSLDEHGMVCDLDLVDAALRDAVAEVDGKNLDETVRPPDAEAVTVEILAHWFHAALAEPVRAAGGESLAVRVWESPTAYGGYRAPLTSSS